MQECIHTVAYILRMGCASDSDSDSCVLCRRAPHWGPLESFSREMEESLRGARLWLGLWLAFGFRRLAVVKDVEECLVSTLLYLA